MLISQITPIIPIKRTTFGADIYQLETQYDAGRDINF